MSKVFCIVVAIVLAIAALFVGKNANRMFGYYVAKVLGIAAAVFLVLAIVAPGSGDVVDMEYCVLSAIIWGLICLAIFFKLLPYIIGIAIVGLGIWLLAWVFNNAMADGGIFGTSVIVAVLFFVTLFIFRLIKKAVK